MDKVTDEDLNLAIAGKIWICKDDCHKVFAELLALRREKAEGWKEQRLAFGESRRFALAAQFTQGALAQYAACDADDPENMSPEEIAKEVVTQGLATADEFLRRIGEEETS